VPHTLHTVKITGNLTFDSKHKNFGVAFREFIENENDEGIQLQITDMLNTNLPSIEIGVKILVKRSINSLTPCRFAEQTTDNPQAVENNSILANNTKKRPTVTKTEISNDSYFY
jgi:hypothetical protein